MTPSNWFNLVPIKWPKAKWVGNTWFFNMKRLVLLE